MDIYDNYYTKTITSDRLYRCELAIRDVLKQYGFFGLNEYYHLSEMVAMLEDDGITLEDDVIRRVARKVEETSFDYENDNILHRDLLSELGYEVEL